MLAHSPGDIPPPRRAAPLDALLAPRPLAALPQALNYLQQAADQGDRNAHFLLGMMNLQGTVRRGAGRGAGHGAGRSSVRQQALARARCHWQAPSSLLPGPALSHRKVWRR
jgi:hypothetical protein